MEEKSKYSLLVSSCDSYHDMWHPFFTLIKRYWNPQVPIYLSTESKKFEFEGFDIKCPMFSSKNDYEWSERLQKVLQNIDTEYVLFILDDFWIKSEVIVENINKALCYLEEDKKNGFFCLIPQREQDGNHIDCKYPEFYLRAKHSPFRITTQAGLWRKSFLQKILRSHENIWFFETRATWRSRYFYSDNVYTLRSSVNKTFDYPIAGVVGGGKFIENEIQSYINDESLEISLDRGITSVKEEKKRHEKVKKNLNYYINKFKSTIPW